MVVYGTRIYIPTGPIRKQMLDRLHTGHLGITRCSERAKEAIWWPSISADIKSMISQCEQCIEHRPLVVESLLPSKIPDRPWQIVGTDLFQCKNNNYIIFVDYFSRYFEIAELRSTSATAVISVAKKIFARFGVPEVVRTDNGPQYRDEFKRFAEKWQFELVTSSPYHSRSNGQVEAAVKIAKSILLKKEKVEQGLLVYRATPLETGYSPAELMMGRKLRSNIPLSEEKLQPNWAWLKDHKEKLQEKRKKDKQAFDRRHRARELNELKAGQRVWITDRKEYGRVVERRSEPRSYKIETTSGIIRRNRAFLVAAQSTGGDIDYEDFIKQQEVTGPGKEPNRMQPQGPQRRETVGGPPAKRRDERPQEAYEPTPEQGEENVLRRSTRERKAPSRYDPADYE
ncbi:unnamed protein product [Lasius platythorax]|uniref:RNA-directed DNA polymerase n=2 Tax=Lasius platythorax TaxID=488582 RepID=A0AAV2MXE9_9HYME